MTRFARAKGSKASNERREEDATPWHVMRQQLAEQLSNHHQAQSGNTIQLYNLKEIGGKAQGEEVWSDLGETTSKHKTQSKSNAGKKGNEICNINTRLFNFNAETIKNLPRKSGFELTNANKKTEVEKKNFKKEPLSNLNNKSKYKDQTKTDIKFGKCKLNEEDAGTSSINVMKREVSDSHKTKVNMKIIKKNKLKNVLKNKAESGKPSFSKTKKHTLLLNKNVFIETLVESNNSSVAFLGSTDLHNSQLNPLCKKKNPGIEIKSNDKREKDTKNNLDTPHMSNTNSMLNSFSTSIKSPKMKQNSSFKLHKETNSNDNNKPFCNSAAYNCHKKNCGDDNFSKYPQMKNRQTIIANGREIHVIKYQGFLIKKEDADELKKLRKKLLAKNIPKEELETIVKLQRRKAEKALAREKKKVCYHCRQFGHNFSDCPEIKDSEVGKTGVCFKCGSTEHSHFECKVLQHQEFRHAVCFVCREQGHIARQCPLNSQGLYPKGGSCHLCGEITHLRKDCPKAVEEKNSKSVTVDILKGGIEEDIGRKSVLQKETENRPNKKKVIKFK